MTIDGRSIRAKNIYDDIHKKLVNSAIELFNNPDIENEKINISMIAKNAGTSVATAYNHFPDNLIDVFGSIFTIGFNNVVESLQQYTETHSDPYEQLNAYINIQTQTAIHLGNALREAFYQFRELLNSEKWIKGEPYDFLLSMCKNYVNINNINLNAATLADDIFVLWNGNIYLWMRYNPSFEVWSKFTDEWLVDEMSKIIDKAISIQK